MDADIHVSEHATVKFMSRSNAMTLGFILAGTLSASTTRTSCLASEASSPRKPYSPRKQKPQGDPAQGDTLDAEATARAVQTILDVISSTQPAATPVQDIRGWAPADGRPYSLLDASDMPTVSSAIGPLKNLHRPAQRARVSRPASPAPVHVPRPFAHLAAAMPTSASDAGVRTRVTASTSYSSAMVPGGGSFEQQVTRAQTAVCAPSVPASPGSAATLAHLLQMQMPPRSASRASTPIAVSLSVQRLSALTRMHHDPSRAHPTPLSARRAPPPPPRGGVSPARARSITHIRLAREQAQQYVARTYAARARQDAGAPRQPSVLARWPRPAQSVLDRQ